MNLLEYKWGPRFKTNKIHQKLIESAKVRIAISA